uniref:hypothetical protein n=1 Tax=uncultured Sphingomonas sp. TaxID=158754 RepID=UPI0035CB0598
MGRLGRLGNSGAGAVIGNAIFNATGIRGRQYPITLDKHLDYMPPCLAKGRAFRIGGRPRCISLALAW